jgi:hypothetical protein
MSFPIPFSVFAGLGVAAMAGVYIMNKNDRPFLFEFQI